MRTMAMQGDEKGWKLFLRESSNGWCYFFLPTEYCLLPDVF